MIRWHPLAVIGVLIASALPIAAQTTTTTSSTTTTTIQPCGTAGAVDLWADNESGLAIVTIDVEGTLDADAVTCGGGPDLRTSYAATLVCAGTGVVRCTDTHGTPVRIDGLQPGAWVHRVVTTVPVAPGEPVNDTQRQARRGIVVASPPDRAAVTSVVWVVHGFTRAVTSDEPGALRDVLFAATQWTLAHRDRHA